MLIAPIVGVVLLVLTVVDVLWTTLSVRGAGPATQTICVTLWRPIIWLGRRRRRSPLLAAVGPLVVGTLVMCWVVMLWLGWLLVFLAEHGSVVDGATNLRHAGAVCDPRRAPLRAA